MGFYASNDLTNCIKALKEDWALRMRLQSHRSTHHVTIMRYMQHDKNTEYKHRLTVKFCYLLTE